MTLREQLEAAEVGSVAVGNGEAFTKMSSMSADESEVYWDNGDYYNTLDDMEGYFIDYIIPPSVLATCRVEADDE